MENWLETLRDALDHVEYGVLLLDDELRAQFINKAFRQMWSLPEPVPGQIHTFETLMLHGRYTGAYQIPEDKLEAYVAERIARVKSGHDGPRLLRLMDKRVIKFECIPLPQGGRMLTYADQTELIRTVEKLEEVVNIDELTKLHNRRYLYVQGQIEVSRAQRYGRPVSVVMLDLDHFKQVNDVYGHASGDALLVAVARCCRNATRASDVVGRLGGEEFGIVLPETPHEAALTVAEKLRAGIAENAVDLGSVKLHATASLGVATLTAHDKGLEDLLRYADHAMYAAKQGGRNRVVAATR